MELLGCHGFRSIMQMVEEQEGPSCRSPYRAEMRTSLTSFRGPHRVSLPRIQFSATIIGVGFQFHKAVKQVVCKLQGGKGWPRKSKTIPDPVSRAEPPIFPVPPFQVPPATSLLPSVPIRASTSCGAGGLCTPRRMSKRRCSRTQRWRGPGTPRSRPPWTGHIRVTPGVVSVR